MNNKKLLFSVTKKDLQIDYYSGKGPGGQNRNKNQNCVRIRHKDSGAIVTAQEEKSRKTNLTKAFQRLTVHPKFRVWLNRKIYEMSEQHKIDEKAIQLKVNSAMQEKNLNIEYFIPKEN